MTQFNTEMKHSNLSKVWSFGLLGAILLGALPAQPVMAQEAGANDMPVAPQTTPIERPQFGEQIFLYPEAIVEEDREHWELGFGGRIARNVVNPSLIPVLPNPLRANGAAVIVAPGGAWMFLGMDTEGIDVARRLADRGIAAFVLKYRTAETPRDPRPFLGDMFARLGVLMADKQNGTNNASFEGIPEAIEDGKAAVRLVRARAAEWGIDPDRVGMLGFSAGATTSVQVALSPDAQERPDFVGSIYGTGDVGPIPEYAPPLFAATAFDDPLVSMVDGGLLPDWAAAGRPVEVHIYERGGHGFGYGVSGQLWFEQFMAWLETRGMLEKPE
jgi:acetyl esterase/lipase